MNAPRWLTVGGSAVAIASAGVMAFLAHWEDGGRRQAEHVVYADKLAGGLPTACNGITKWTSPVPVVVGDVWSQEKCDEIGAQIVETTQRELAKCLKVAVPQPVFDALTSHAHNFGYGDTCGSLAVSAINRGEIARGCDLLAWTPEGRPNWASVGCPDCKFIQGLHNRRLSERRLCRQGVE